MGVASAIIGRGSKFMLLTSAHAHSTNGQYLCINYVSMFSVIEFSVGIHTRIGNLARSCYTNPDIIFQ